MDLNSKYESEIEAYVHGDMSAEAKHDFEKILDSNPELKSEVNLLLSLKESYNRKDVYDLKRKLEGFSLIRESNEVKNKSKKTFFWAIAAAAIIIIAFGLVYFISDNVNSSLNYKSEIISGLASFKIIDPEFKVLLSISNSRSSNSELTLSDSLFLDIHSVFDQAKLNEAELPKFIDYGRAILKKTEFPTAYKESTTILLCRAYLIQNQPKEALSILESVPSDSQYSCFAKYYQSIALAILKKFDEANSNMKSEECNDFKTVFKSLESKIE